MIYAGELAYLYLHKQSVTMRARIYMSVTNLCVL